MIKKIKYVSSYISLLEVPDEISLVLQLSLCPHHCEECHSSYLRNDIGIELTINEVKKLLTPDITCICLMGGDNYHEGIISLCNEIKQLNLKTCMYSGDFEIDDNLLNTLDYYKVGPYIKEFGPLDNKNTNQRFYKIVNDKVEDITHIFQER